jgi:RNA polymerase sigma factor (sigma-70 family)
MKIFVYSYDINHITHWETTLPKADIVLIEDAQLLTFLVDELIIMAYDKSTNMQKTVQAVAQHNLVLILDNVPTVQKAKQLFAYGVRGYGNILLSQSYMQFALQTIQSHHVWISPTITQALIQEMQQAKSNTNTHAHEVLKQLTQKEQEVAKLLKKGLSNMQIAQQMNVSINTIKSHIKNIYSKVGVKDKIAFVMLLQ